ncbi:RNA polymerase sigma-70 factor (ECF subfamily) [Salirhabdus euzebyi]|uniref:RNA polymerase sigma factor n=1 Tax=Salirhabdus euzebyi TaxID=394506 RepID=A0A841Q933_9BACI|nr:RNA polymerase sigma factor [Salirhabdus euzebyi]MBB6454772.1 RNA polymerase sigma-70 factor (ECF subfamily) [Salirhabdus euzebyi]
MSGEKVITEWYHQYKHDIYQYLIYFTGTSDVEDIIQEAFIRALKNIDNFHGTSSPKTWLISIARNAAIDEMRKRKRSKIVQKQSYDDKLEPVSTETPEDFVQFTEMKKELYHAIQNLRKNYRDVVILRGIKEMSIAETASILNWNENKVRITYHRALKSLSQQGGVFDE